MMSKTKKIEYPKNINYVGLTDVNQKEYEKLKQLWLKIEKSNKFDNNTNNDVTVK